MYTDNVSVGIACSPFLGFFVTGLNATLPDLVLCNRAVLFFWLKARRSFLDCWIHFAVFWKPESSSFGSISQLSGVWLWTWFLLCGCLLLRLKFWSFLNPINACGVTSLSPVLSASFLTLLPLLSFCNSLRIEDTSWVPILVRIIRFLICITNPGCNPMIDANHQTHYAAMIYWCPRPKDIILSIAYPITSFLLSTVIVIGLYWMITSEDNTFQRCRAAATES